MDSLKELSEFLNINTRLDLKVVAVQSVLHLTGNKECLDILLGYLDTLKKLVILMQDESITIAKDAALSAINISTNEAGANAFLTISESSQEDKEEKYSHNLIHVCMSCIMDKNSILADPCCMILSNMTRTRYIMDRNSYGIKRLLPFTEYIDSEVRRGGIIGTLKNCCFDTENHEWLLSKDINILSYLLLPLAGPEEFDEEENDKLPLDLQYLPSTKEREPDPDIRVMLLEALEQLCATKKGREILRSNNTYLILRELHKSEKCKEVLLACENVVDILIRTEEEIGLDNIKDVDVPVEYKEKFEKMDEEFINST
ncbi:hypothetical protein M0802_009602 [Mischocyttarus mexicanus]|nr:hypothetical protein M0802_009602 [Mischocyttarus mexicanus]